ncbi:hypothetical protein D3C76_1431960 [compost metagenome]
MPASLLKIRLNCEKLVNPHCSAMPDILRRVWISRCWALRTRVVWMYSVRVEPVTLLNWCDK